MDCLFCKFINRELKTDIVYENDDMIIIRDRIKELTGIDDEKLDEGVKESKVADDLYKLLSPGTLMVAHNCQFDLNFIYNLLCKYYDENKIDNLFNYGKLFVMPLATYFVNKINKI